MKLILYKKKVLTDPNSLETEELKKLHSLPNGEKALLYVYLAKDASATNPFKDLSYKDRQHEAEMRVYGKGGVPRNIAAHIQAAIDTYPLSDEEVNMYTYNKKMDELGELLRKTEPKIERNQNTNTDVVSFSTNISIINSILKDITNIIQAKASLTALYTLGRLPKHLRGRLSPLAKQKIKL